MKTVATALDQLENDLKEAEYHAYAGISSARTAIDSSAGWLNIALKAGQQHNSGLNLSRKDFRKRLLNKAPVICSQLIDLGVFGEEINQHRQGAQHREGLPLNYHAESTALNLSLIHI